MKYLIIALFMCNSVFAAQWSKETINAYRQEYCEDLHMYGTFADACDGMKAKLNRGYEVDRDSFVMSCEGEKTYVKKLREDGANLRKYGNYQVTRHECAPIPTPQPTPVPRDCRCPNDSMKFDNFGYIIGADPEACLMTRRGYEKKECAQ